MYTLFLSLIFLGILQEWIFYWLYRMFEYIINNKKD